MRFPLNLRPKAAIAPDLNLRLRLRDKAAPGKAAAAADTPPAECVPCCGGLEVTLASGITRHGDFPDTWLYPCGASASFSLEVVANVELCGRTDFEWSLDIIHFTGGAIVISSSDTDDDGRPRVTLTGTVDDCTIGAANEALIWLTLGGVLFCSPLHIRPGCSPVPFYAASGDGLGPSSTFGQPPSLTFKSDGENVFVNVSVGGVCPETVITWNVDPSSCGIGYSTGTAVATDDFISFGWVTFLTCPCSFTIEAIVDGVSLGVIDVVCEP